MASVTKENRLRMNAEKIITVGFNPVWDRTCYMDGAEWCDHTVMASQTLTPAGKAMNISRALAWMSVPSTAAGLWSAADYPDMIEALAGFQDYIRSAFTVVEGAARQNVTVVDMQKNREMHLRSPKTLVTQEALTQLGHDLQGQLNPRASVIFAGSIPEGNIQDECISIITRAGCQCAKLIVDTSGNALREIVDSGNVGVIKPNIEELSELLGESVEEDADAVILASRQLCNRVKVIIVSLGQKGAVAVTKDAAVYCRIKKQRRVVHTVGCGDYLLAGYVSVSDSAEISQKLATGVKAATAKAWGVAGSNAWPQAQGDMEVETRWC